MIAGAPGGYVCTYTDTRRNDVRVVRLISRNRMNATASFPESLKLHAHTDTYAGKGQEKITSAITMLVGSTPSVGSRAHDLAQTIEDEFPLLRVGRWRTLDEIVGLVLILWRGRSYRFLASAGHLV